MMLLRPPTSSSHKTKWIKSQLLSGQYELVYNQQSSLNEASISFHKALPAANTQML